jgi:hypothetical protein
MMMGRTWIAWKRVSLHLSQTKDAEQFAAQDRLVQDVRKRPPPSSAARLLYLVKEGRGRLEGRPGPLVGLYNPVFAEFQTSLNDLSLAIPPTVYTNVAKLFSVSTSLWPDEASRSAHMKEPLTSLIGTQYIVQDIGSARSDGVVITSTSNRPIAYRAFIEIKTEIGTGGSDPVAQGAKAYEKYWAQAEVRCINSSIIYLTPFLVRQPSIFLLLPKLYHRHRRAMDVYPWGYFC